MSRGKYNALEKLTILEEVSNGEIGFLAAATKYGINKTTLMKWQRRYKTHGYKGLERRTHLQRYSAELKLQAVKDYLEGACLSIRSSINTRLLVRGSSSIGLTSIMVIAA